MSDFVIESCAPDSAVIVSVAVTGVMPEIAAGEQAVFQGEWVTHPQYGKQFKASQLEILKPSTLLGVERYEEISQDVLVPDIKGLTISQARRTLTDAGLNMLDDGVSDVVLEQLPPAGALLPSGGHVMVYTAESLGVTPDTLILVPDFSGLSDIDCARVARLRGLTLQLEGTGVCIRQTPAAGEYVAPGTEVRMTLSTADE